MVKVCEPPWIVPRTDMDADVACTQKMSASDHAMSNKADTIKNNRKRPLQLTDIDLFVGAARSIGLQRAWDECRHRRTGRTIRDILELARKVSAGERIILINDNNKERSRDMCWYVMRKVADVLQFMGCEGVHVSTTVSIEYPTSGGRIVIMTPSSNKRGLLFDEEFYLHDN